MQNADYDLQETYDMNYVEFRYSASLFHPTDIQAQVPIADSECDRKFAECFEKACNCFFLQE